MKHIYYSSDYITLFLTFPNVNLVQPNDFKPHTQPTSTK